MKEDLCAHYSNQVTMCAELDSSSGPAHTNLHVSAPTHIISWVCFQYNCMSEVVRWYDSSIYLKASFHDFSFTFILFFIFRGKFQLAKEEDIVEKSVLSQRELCKSMPSTLPNFSGVWLKLCHEQYFF